MIKYNYTDSIKNYEKGRNQIVLITTLMNGSEAWNRQRKDERRRNVVVIRSLRHMYGRTMYDRITNEEIKTQ